MKTKYCFIRNPHHFTREDVVYTVYVGTSEREQVLLTLIGEYVKDTGIYFKKWSNTVDITLLELRSHLFRDSIQTRFYLRTASVSVSDLYRLIIDDSWYSFEKTLTTPRAQFHLISMLSPSFFFANSPVGKKVSASSAKRKNLSHNGDSELVSAVVHFGLILVLFLFAGYLEGVCVCHGW